jgi:hypothetical protein
MILVTGTKRSGTSLWMQVLTAAGLEYIGSKYAYSWEQSIGDANPRGFYESLLRRGIFWETNPHPETGRYLSPAPTRRYLVKVFIPGLVRSDIAFLDHVVASVRPWREYCTSLARLYQMEDEHLGTTKRKDGKDPVAEARKNRGPLPPEVEWYFENYNLVRDIASRRYRYHLVGYTTLIEDPEETIHRVLQFLGGDPDVASAVGVVEPSLRSQHQAPYESTHLKDDEIQLFDDFVGTIENREPLSKALLDRMNEINRQLRKRFEPVLGEFTRARMAEKYDLSLP